MLKSIESIARVNKEIEACEKVGVTSYIFAIQYKSSTVSFVKMPTTDVRQLAEHMTESGSKILFKATTIVKNILKNYEVVKEVSTIEIEKLINDKVNRGNAAEMIFFGYDEETCLASQEKVDGIFEGEKIQMKASLISWKGTKNNGVGTATFVA